MKSRFSATIMCAILLVSSLTLPGCSRKVNTQPGQSDKPAITGDDVLRGAKVFGQVLATSLDQGINLERALAQDATIDPALEPKIRQKLADGKKGVDRFNARIAKYDHFDPASKADIAAFLDEAIAFINDLNNDGILQIKNPRSQLIASGILLSASTAVTIYKSTFDQAK